MRTTVTFDPDVAARLARLQAAGKLSFKQAVNEAVREWLDRAEQPARARSKPFRQKTYDVKPLFPVDRLPSDLLKELQEEDDLDRFAVR